MTQEQRIARLETAAEVAMDLHTRLRALEPDPPPKKRTLQ